MALRLTRRKSLKVGLWGLGFVSANSSLSHSNDRVDVTVIGAGLSGLYSAMLLEEQGFKVRVVEATNEIGLVQTKSPFLTPSAKQAICRALVALLQE